jgi:hypothetical protein
VNAKPKSLFLHHFSILVYRKWDDSARSFLQEPSLAQELKEGLHDPNPRIHTQRLGIGRQGRSPSPPPEPLGVDILCTVNLSFAELPTSALEMEMQSSRTHQPTACGEMGIQYSSLQSPTSGLEMQSFLSMPTYLLTTPLEHQIYLSSS